jgi:uncharacterized protein YbjT (DUF2867 family)
MKIAVFGGTGRTGVPLLKEALDRGLEVKALVRTPAKMNFSGQKLEVIEGDALDENDVRKTVEGTDAVISVLGPAKGSPDSLMKDAAEVITRVMKETGVRRIVWLTGAGVKDDRDEKALSRTMIRGLMKIVAGKVLSYSEEAYRIVTTADLDYTVPRAPMLSEDPTKGPVEAGYTPPKPKPLSREDVARFILDVVEEGKFKKESPMIGY